MSANTVWEVRGTVLNGSPGPGVDTNGGGWAPLTVSTFSGSDLVVDASLNTKVTSATHNFVAADVGARLFITNAPGTWTAGFYTINSVASNAATLSSSPAAISSTGGAWSMVGVDRSQQNAAQVVIDNSLITTSITANVITFAGYVPTVADVGNVVQMLTGTNVTAGFYQITAFTGSTWTVTGTVALPTSGTTVNATGNMGGALGGSIAGAGLTKLAGTGANAMIASNKAYVTGAFTATATTTFAQTVVPTPAAPATRLIGYGATRTDSVQATLTLSTNTGLTGISLTGNGFTVENLAVNCASLGTSSGINSAAGRFLQIRACKVSNAATVGIGGGTDGNLVADCEVTGCLAGGVSLRAGTTADQVLRCFVHDNACLGLSLGNETLAAQNVIVNNTGASSDGILASYNCVILNNTIHGNGRDGIRVSGANAICDRWQNNILTNNGVYGLNNTGTAFPADPAYDGNAYFSNTSGSRNNVDSTTGIYGVNSYTNTRDVTLTVSPYVGGTTGTTANFALNNTAGGGAACRAAGNPSTFAGNTGTTSYLDMGAVQTRGSASSPNVGTPGIIQATG